MVRPPSEAVSKNQTKNPKKYIRNTHMKAKPDRNPIQSYSKIFSDNELAEIKILVWIAQLDKSIAQEEHDLIEHLIAKILLKHLKIRSAHKIAISICNEHVHTNEIPELISKLDSDKQRKRILELAQLLVKVHRSKGEGEDGTEEEIQALDYLRDLIDINADSAVRTLLEGHALKGLLRGPQLAPLPTTLSRLRSDTRTKLIKPAGLCLKNLQWRLPIGRFPAWVGELGLLGMECTHAFYAFTCTHITPRAGILILPGGFVDFRAYVRTARELARQGLVVVVQNVPLGFAFLDRDRALAPGGTIRTLFPHIEHWSVAGHSLGGVAASAYALQQPDDIDSLILWASFPSPTHSLRHLDIPVMSLCGSEDALVSPAQVDKMRHLLPPKAKIVVLEGANHTQFGDYWDGHKDFYVQSGDSQASLSRQRQRKRVVGHTLGFLNELGILK